MTSVPDPTPDPVGEQQRRPTLTPRELEILRLWLRSESKTVAASDLGISLGTINTHLIRIRAKYASAGRPAADRSGLLIRALQDWSPWPSSDAIASACPRRSSVAKGPACRSCSVRPGCGRGMWDGPWLSRGRMARMVMRASGVRVSG
ncbi:LuxR C-terminal-related transcriptional regulator [Rhodococcus opacus]|uniref:LuxR C-terminal-related transcriptional regulator n=1 Tax=Rhodococcus opacus TaxID=37919 RepID=A0AAX3YV75_RHOOP|nr:LuxR C-terminal-related transcriptional regulator [Rhodococcus opacus]MCZ4590123.1 LuxR C-terminal-related transcriptional regulator [Rhodococcus opacus]WLF52159.1 LuxR C-terminal-related transcriptional regulator [Rhodococcus opacus]